MITIPTSEQQAFQGSSPKELILEFPIGRTLTNENIFMESASLEQAICDESNLTFGMVYSSCFTVRIFDDGKSYSGLRVFPHISVDGYTRDLGSFTVKSDKLTSDKIYRDLKCYDALSDVLPFDYSEWHNKRGNSYTLKQYRDSFFNYIGIEQESISLPNDNVSLTKFTVTKLSGSQILSAILQLNGCFGYIGYNGKFKYVLPKTVQDYSITDYSFVQGSFEYEDEPMKSITGVTIKGYSDDYGEDSYSVDDVNSGDDTGSVFTIENNYLIQSEDKSKRQTLCNNIFVNISGFTFYPASVQFPAYVGLELGDVFQITTERKTVKFPVLKRTLTGITALKDTLEAKGENEISSNANSVSGGVDSAQMAINQIRISVAELLSGKVSTEELTAVNGKIENLETNYLVVNSVLEANTADIATLNAKKANVADLSAINAQISSLNANKANITDLNAANANITNLQSGFANISTLLAGNAGAGDLQVINLTVDNTTMSSALIKRLVSQNITVSDLLAGTIDTSRFLITSPDGGIEISDNTQTFKDKNGNVRIQMGQDASGNFTFVLYDETGTGVLIDSTGIKDSAISDGLIKDKMVASDAAIQGSKLDIASVVTELNKDGTPVLKSSKIWFDESGQNLTQMYSQMSSRITLVGSDASDALSTASNAEEIARTANDNAQIAIKALEGITSLDNLTAILTNDAHVVHTYFDGSGGSYVNANTTVYVYKGDTDVSEHAQIEVEKENGVTGIWNSNTRTYQVTSMSEDNGYVDFVASYGVTTGYLYLPDGQRLLMPNNNLLKLNSDVARVHKRFSISKSPDGRAGASYDLIASAVVISKTEEGIFTPPSITFTAKYNSGMSIEAFVGRIVIDESRDGSAWTEKYRSTILESEKTYIPSNTAKFVRASLYDYDGTFLDMQSVIIIADTDEISGNLQVAQEAIQVVENRVGTVESGIEGLNVNLAKTRDELYGLSDGTLLFQTPYTMNGDIATFNAKLYRSGTDVHSDYPDHFFTWYRKTENGTDYLGFGYSMQVNRTSVGYGGSIVGVFNNWDEGLLVMPDNNYLKLPNGKRLMVYAE